MIALGRQVIIEMYDADPKALADATIVEDIFLEAAKEANATILWSYFHPFEPQGVSGVIVIAESHFTVHTWPEYRYAAIDIFYCSETVNVEKAVEVFKRRFNTKEIVIVGDLNRGVIDTDGNMRIPANMEIKQPEYYTFSWEKKFKESNARAISASIDLHDVDSSSMEDMAKIEHFLKEIEDKFNFIPSGEMEVSYSKEDNEYTIILPMKNSSLTLHVDIDENRVAIDAYSNSFFEPRELAEFALKYFGGKHYTLEVALRK